MIRMAVVCGVLGLYIDSNIRSQSLSVCLFLLSSSSPFSVSFFSFSSSSFLLF